MATRKTGPYKAVSPHPDCPAGMPHATVHIPTGDVMKCHTTPKDAQDMALTLNIPDATGPGGGPAIIPAAAWDESKHLRKPRGHGGGEFADTPGGGESAPGKASPGKAAPAADPKTFLGRYSQWRDSLPPAQDKAMRFYQSPGFALMNGQLRGLDTGKLKTSEHASDTDLARASKASKDLTAAIRKAPPLEAPVTVYRGFSATQFGALKPGSVITDKGFTSTSLTPDVGAVGRATKPATAEIVLPAGTRAAAGSARELVLPPGSSFRVAAVTQKGGVMHVQLELMMTGRK